jgi:eukaryotic-like serine/threonine-protein kinase
VCWTRDSRYLFLAAAKEEGAPNRILRLTVETGDTTEVATPSDSGRGYVSPDLSPDGRTLAFTHLDVPESITMVSLSDSFEPVSTRTISGGHNVGWVRWTPNGRDLLIQYFVGLPLTLFRIPASGGEATPVSWVGPGAEGYVALRGSRMVFGRSSRDTNIVRVDLRSAGDGAPAIDRVAQSSFREVSPEYSPDGTRLAFTSNRSGSVQIWTSNADGSQPVQLTSMDPIATTGTPRWSRDGREIAFDSNAGGVFQVYVVGSGGGRPRALTSGSAQNFGASWSPDGRWIYFSSNRAGSEIWRVPPGGGTPEQVTHMGASNAVISRDGTSLYVSKGNGAGGIWRVPIDGGTPVRLVDRIYRYNFAPTDGGLYYIVGNENGAGGTLNYLDLTTGASRKILTIDKTLDLGLALSPDGQYLLFTQVDYTGDDLMMVDNFR